MAAWKTGSLTNHCILGYQHRATKHVYYSQTVHFAHRKIGFYAKSSSLLPFHLGHKEEGTGGSNRDSFTEEAT
jgi:hypothetical protein